MARFNFFIFARNWLLVLFMGWLIVSPVPNPTRTSNQQPSETIYKISGGGREQYEPKSSTSQIKSFSQNSKTSSQLESVPQVKSPSQDSKTSLEPKEFQPGTSVKFKPGKGDPAGNNDDDDYNVEIGTKNWKERICPNPDQIISNPDFWNTLQNDSETCLNEDDEDDCWDIELESSDERPHRRLLANQPAPAPVPTGKLDQTNLQKYDFTTKKVQPFTYTSREGLTLSADHRSIRKIIYSHPEELGLTDLINRIPCPIQLDPNKFQRLDCWAITDNNMKEAIIKLFEFTTFQNANIITVEMPMHECLTNRATYFINKNTGASMYFRKGGQQDGKLWSITRFDPNSVSTMLDHPSVYLITDFNQNPDLN